MSIILPLVVDDAPPDIAKTYAEIEASFGMIPNLFQTQAHFEPLLKTSWESVKLIMLSQGSLSRKVTCEVTMAHWLIPANIKFYNVFGAFSKKETYWPTNTKVAVGDLAFIYLAAPFKQIGFFCEVTEMGLSFEVILPHIQHFFRQTIDRKKKPKSFIKLHPIVSVPIAGGSPLSYEQLKQNGLTGI